MALRAEASGPDWRKEYGLSAAPRLRPVLQPVWSYIAEEAIQDAAFDIIAQTVEVMFHEVPEEFDGADFAYTGWRLAETIDARVLSGYAVPQLQTMCSCDPDAWTWSPLLSPMPLHEGHLSMRFGDYAAQPYLDGEKLTACFEFVVEPGGTGVAACLKEPLAPCLFHKELSRELRRGKLTFERKGPRR